MNDTVSAAVIGGAAVVTSGITAAVLAFLGMRFSAKTSLDGSARLASVSEKNNAALIRSSVESKIAEMRVEWNDDLRVSLARFAAAIASVVTALSHGHTAENQDKQYWYSYIALKLNHQDTTHKELLELANKMMLFVNDLLAVEKEEREREAEKHLKDFSRLFSEFGAKSSNILKVEWDRAKREARENWATNNTQAFPPSSDPR